MFPKWDDPDPQSGSAGSTSLNRKFPPVRRVRHPKPRSRHHREPSRRTLPFDSVVSDPSSQRERKSAFAPSRRITSLLYEHPPKLLRDLERECGGYGISGFLLLDQHLESLSHSSRENQFLNRH